MQIDPKLTPAYLAELAVDNGEGAAQIEIKDKALRESLILNVKKQMERAVKAALQAHGVEL